MQACISYLKNLEIPIPKTEEKIKECVDKISKKIDWEHQHSGFVWACDRVWFQQCNFVDITAVSSGGDAIFTDFVTKRHNTNSFDFYKYHFDTSMNLGNDFTLGSCDLHVFHLCHGSRNHRQFVSIIDLVKQAIKDLNINKLKDIVQRRNDRILEWKPEYKDAMNNIMITFFKNRFEDEASE
jgi:hypothetical protein